MARTELYRTIRHRIPLALLIALAMSCGPSPQVSAGPRIYTVLTSGHLLVASASDMKVVADITLTTSPVSTPRQVHGMVLSADASVLYALVQDSARSGHIAVINTRTLTVTKTIDIVGRADFRGLALGRTGPLWVFANEGANAVIWTVGLADGTAPLRRVARESDGRNWLVYEGVVDESGATIFLSYHGPDTTGIDRFEIRGPDLVRCGPGRFPSEGCIGAHGGLRLVGNDLIVTTGESGVLALDPATGAVRHKYDVSLEGNHVMEFAVADDAQRLFVVGSCGYSRGLSATDIVSGTTRVLFPSRLPSSPCGERIVTSRDGQTLVVAQTALPVPTTGTTGRILVLDAEGRERGRIETPAESIDLLLGP